MKLGDLEFHVLTDGTFRLDGGAMFGVVPKTMWARKSPPDDRNRILLSMLSLLIRTGGKTILVETGAGNKWDAKFGEIYAIGGESPLLDQLALHGVQPEDVDMVINTHLHFDHCGWNTRIVGGQVVPTFPNAQYCTQRGEYEHAISPNERDRASYIMDNFAPIETAGKWRLLTGDVEITPGIEVVRMPGHTANMQGVRLTGGGKTVIFFADLVPTAAHIPFVWVMGYDLYPMTTMENKKKWIPQAAREGWLCIFAHDPVVRGAYIKGREGKFEIEPVNID
ncbi:MAG: MBL fold metallo-hydrolase [Acidobacteria bacterium]|nr:MBL fold metallo-hydrolase [Acidobacteriota bacterium]